MASSSSQPLAMTQDTLWGLVKRNPTMAPTDIYTHGPDQASQASDKPSPEDTQVTLKPYPTQLQIMYTLQHWGHPLEYKYPVPDEIQGITLCTSLILPLGLQLFPDSPRGVSILVFCYCSGSLGSICNQ
ncbi:hypothetical protein DSO57_1012145 [Entomophthora muscae]|uniref:Uncharacterized protein n=1 Tax=Entomophthora muscae TaxID=34485 RepID=A0ACC2U5I1_9FUNG|nr:hypothetical protein DSO57_1012145 [Entomophthora muscae]